MFFSAKQLLQNADSWDLRNSLEEYFGEEVELSLNKVKKYVAACKKSIVERNKYCSADNSGDGYNLHKWFRPWHIIPALREFSAPEGDYGIGIELEASFNSVESARNIASKVQHWRNITLDFEYGISNPIEATFPPFLYSKMSSKCQPFRYAKLLKASGSGVRHHSQNDEIGCHVNVSKGGCTGVSYRRTSAVSNMIEYHLSRKDKDKYFGRNPYGYCYDNDKYIEFKLFNSTTDPKVLRRYIHIAVALADIIYGEQEITTELVRSALSTAYNKR